MRTTVPDPDSSWRPSPEQVRQAYSGFRALAPEEQELLDRVSEALATSGLDPASVQLEVDHARVLVHGQVADMPTLERIGAVIADVDGVEEVIDKLVVAPSAEQRG